MFANFGYRLSLWGYPHAAEIAEAGETQNFGLLDTRAAVEWLRDNVKQFGGDPTKITLGGKMITVSGLCLILTRFCQASLLELVRGVFRYTRLTG